MLQRIGWSGLRVGAVLCANSICSQVQARPMSASGQICPSCRHALPEADGAGFARRTVAVIRSARCGQSTWLVRGLDEITREAERYRFPIAAQEKIWEEDLKTLSVGRPLPSTPGLPGPAWCLDFAASGELRRLYAYDTAAVETTDSRRFSRHRNCGLVTGFVVVLDPFGLAGARQRYLRAVGDLRPPVSPTPEAFNEAQLAVVLKTPEVHREPPRGGVWDIAVAVVMTKLDALGLGRRFGSERNSADEIHLASKAQAAEWGFDNMTRVLETHFRKVRFFAVWPGGQGPFASGNALRWMFEEVA